MSDAAPNTQSMTTPSEIVHIDASFEPLMPRFMANRKKEIVTMRQALTGQDFETVRSLAHGMKGVGGSYGFDRVTELAATIEQAAKSADTSIITQQLHTLEDYLNAIQITYE
ncbi:MAG TPA: Hpt domain-containing protein [Nitrospira sp.]|nr:Hpt domain-containing protein [Nitrospira sp.]